MPTSPDTTAIAGSRSAAASRVLLFSPRNLKHEYWRCYNFEFEDVVAALDDVDIVAPGYQTRSMATRFVHHRLQRWFGLTPTSRPAPQRVHVERSYDLFFTVMVGPPDLPALDALPDWRQRCGTAVCWIDEIWLRHLRDPRYRKRLERLALFDAVFIACRATAPELAEVIGRPCKYVAPAVDALAFCPHPNPPPRSIDVLALGRRSEETHRALLAAAAERRIHYVYDTAPLRDVYRAAEHRALLAATLQRSRYFLVNPAKVNRPQEREAQEELGYRFFEGAAAGTILLGQPPDCAAYHENFDWPDAVIPLPYGSTAVLETIEAVEADPRRVANTRRDNIVNCLRRHDWAYRWESILRDVGLEPRVRVAQRQRALHGLADELSQPPCATPDARGPHPTASVKR